MQFNSLRVPDIDLKRVPAVHSMRVPDVGPCNPCEPVIEPAAELFDHGVEPAVELCHHGVEPAVENFVHAADLLAELLNLPLYAGVHVAHALHEVVIGSLHAVEVQ